LTINGMMCFTQKFKTTTIVPAIPTALAAVPPSVDYIVMPPHIPMAAMDRTYEIYRTTS
jgi:hypothetical protein